MTLPCRARTLFFLDYFASGKLDSAITELVVSGIADGCKSNGLALMVGKRRRCRVFTTMKSMIWRIHCRRG